MWAFWTISTNHTLLTQWWTADLVRDAGVLTALRWGLQDVGRSEGRAGRVWPRLRRDERGGTLVEAAIIVPLLMLLTFGGIEFGIGFGQKGALESSTRAGARRAATLTADPDNAAQNSIALDTLPSVNAALDSTAVPKLVQLWIYKHNGAFDPEASGCASDCISFTPSPGDPGHFDAATANGSWPLVDRNGCGINADRVSVKIKGQFEFLTGLVGSGVIDLRSTSTLQFEPTNC
jgi:hypothetical protein